jgi:hypothetical protein
VVRVVLLVAFVVVAWPGTPPSNFVRDAGGDVVQCPATLCALSAPRGDIQLAPDAAVACATTVPPPRSDGVTVAAPPPAPPRAAQRAPDTPGARAPPPVPA